MSEQSAIQELYFGTDVLPVAVDGGAFTITLGAHTTASVNFNDDINSVITPALETLPEIGSGNIGVEDVLDGDSNRIGLILTFKGALANTPVAEMTVDSSLTLDASTLDLEPVQSGADPTLVTPTYTSQYTAPVAGVPGVSQVELLDLGGSTTGTISLFYNGSFPATVDIASLISTGVSVLQTALETILGGGDFTTTDNGNGTYSINWIGPYANEPVNSLDTGVPPYWGIYRPSGVDGSPTLTVSTLGVTPIPGVNQQDTITYSQVATIGIWLINTNIAGNGSFQFNDTAATIQAWLRAHTNDGSVSVTGSYSTLFLITYSDYATHDSSNSIASVTNDVNLPLGIGGTQQVFSVTLSTDPVPDSGEWFLAFNSIPTSHISIGDDGAAVTAKLPSGWTAAGDAGGPYTFTATIPASNAAVTAANFSLVKNVGAMIDVIQEGVAPSGGSSGGSRARSLQLLRN